MSLAKRIGNVVTGLLMIFFSLIVALNTDKAIMIITGVFSIALTVSGLHFLIYYLTMARHMVSGKVMLCIGILLLDAGVFTATLTDIPATYVILYLMGVHIFAGAVSVLRALEAKRYDSPAWKSSLAFGILNIVAAVAALVGGMLFNSVNIVIYIYCAGVVNSAIIRIVSAFRRTAVVYIP